MSEGHRWQDPIRPRLLIADDDPVVRSSLSLALEGAFDVVDAVEDGEQAVSRAAALQPDVALIDVQMPGGGAPHAVRGIVEGSPATAIVVISADEQDSLVRDLLQAGAMAYVRKGIVPSELQRDLLEAIRAHGDTRLTG